MKAEIIREGTFLLVQKKGSSTKVKKVIVEKRRTRQRRAPVILDYARSLNDRVFRL